MKRIIFIAATLLTTTFTFAQNADTEIVYEGTVVSKITDATPLRGTMHYMVKDNLTGAEFRTFPTSMNLVIGSQVAFGLQSTFPSAWELPSLEKVRKAPGRTEWEDVTLERAQKARHDAMMATIQAIR